MRFLLTCPFGLSKLIWNELTYLWLKAFDTFETGIYTEWSYQDMIKMNIWSRITNKIYLQVAFWHCFDFDALFALVQTVDRSNYITPWQNIVVNVHTKNSKLESIRTIQAISNKAIYKQLLPNSTWPMDPKKEAVEIYIMIVNDQTSIFINSSGAPLHQRWYRTQTGEAPIKENLAAALVILSKWKYSSPFWDPFCGSWTLGIEAAMLARNIAPGLNRNFAFESWKDVDKDMIIEIKSQSKQKQYIDKKYQILLSDNDPKVLEIAKKNAQNAGVLDTIEFSVHDFLSPLIPHDTKNMTIVSNPPYGKRLTDTDLENLYKNISQTIINSNNGWFITSRKWCEKFLPNAWTRKKLYNWADECRFYFK